MTDYVELHCHSNFSLLDGASHPEDLVARAAALEMPALALTDHDAVYGAVRFRRAACEHGIRPILGAELTLADGQDEGTGHHLTLLVENEAGWHNLCYLISRARHQAPKGEAVLPPQELVGCTNGLIALSGCRRGEIATALRQDDRERALAAARRSRELFGQDNFYIELQHHLQPDDDGLVSQLAALAGYLKLPCVATNNVHYATQPGHKLQDVLVCIRHLTTLDASAHLRRLNSEYYLKSAAQMAHLFADRPQALANTLAVAERCCHFELRYGLQDLPHFATPHGMSSSAYLRRLCEEALPQRYPDPAARVREQLGHELAVIERAGLANYFLIVWDIVRFARQQDIRCQGRGSAANSLVAYLLHISPVDPLAHDLVFERFLSDERRLVPDIDLDFEAARREEVIQYLYRRYGQAHTAMACTFVTFRRRSALRDVARVLGLTPDVVAAAAAALETSQTPAEMEAGDRSAVALLLDLCRQLEGFPRHLGIHAGGMVITGAPLMGRLPTEPATMPGRVVAQWDKDALAEVGLVKIDVLGLRMLSAISDALDLIEATTGTRPCLEELDFAEAAVYEMIGRADTIGVFQVESRAQAQMLPKLRPRCFADLVVAISLIRPGPVQGNMVRPYLRRRLGAEPVTYAHPLLEPVLKETLGVILFQEQVLKVAQALAGFTPGQGEQLRRALGAKRAGAELETFRADFLAGAEANGVPPAVAETVFEQLLGFGSYSFAKSHAAAFAVLVYQSAWLKHHHPVAFYTALLNNQPMGFWTPAVLVNEARRQGITVLPVDLHRSQAQCTIENDPVQGQCVRLGFGYVKGVGEAQIERILKGRQEGAFTGLLDFCRRTRLGRKAVEHLILAGAMDGWGVPRRRLLWKLGEVDYPADDGLGLVFPSADVSLPPLSETEAMLGEQTVLGLSTGKHVMALHREWLEAHHILGSRQLAQCADGRRVRVAGLVVVHQSPPTAKGFHFITLEDEEGMMNVIVSPRVYGRYRQVIRSASLLLVAGIVQQEAGVTNLLARHLARFRP